jgi:hypothetical protein
MEQNKRLTIVKTELTIETLQELLTTKNYTEEQLKEFLFSIKTLAHILMQYQLKNTKNSLVENNKEPLKLVA